METAAKTIILDDHDGFMHMFCFKCISRSFSYASKDQHHYWPAFEMYTMTAPMCEVGTMRKSIHLTTCPYIRGNQVLICPQAGMVRHVKDIRKREHTARPYGGPILTLPA